MRAKADCIERDRRFLLDRRIQFVRVACPACSGRRLMHDFSKQGFEYEKCRDCDTMLMNPRPSRELMREFYATSANYAYWNRHIFPATEDARRKSIFAPRARRLLDLCRTHGVAPGALLEVGAGFGTFCDEVSQTRHFKRIIALEPTPDLAGTCRNRGLETLETTLEDCDLPDGSISVVAAFEVLEHLFDPADLVRSAARLLEPGGLLVLSCPNVRGFDVAALGAKSGTIDHEHVNYLHPESMAVLLKRCGMKVLQISTPGRLDADIVRNAALAGDIDLSQQPLLRRVLIEEWERLGAPFQQFLGENGLSSHMWAAACRPAR